MSNFYSHFLLEDGDRISQAVPRRVFLAGFGKHPGWDDHIEDIGMATRTLQESKRILYINGIGNQIDTGVWDRLEKDKQLSNFDHLFLWRRADQMLMGRIWSSSDGKGRTRYPMIACAHSFGLSLPWMLANGLPRLTDLVRKCITTKSAPEVVRFFGNTQEDLRKLADGKPDDLSATAGPDEIRRRQLLDDPVFGEEGEGMHRLLYCVDSELNAYLPRKKSTATVQTASLSPRHIRVPRLDALVEENASFWSWFFASLCAKFTPTLFLLPLDQPWVDVILGEPTGRELFCMRAKSGASALATTIPYNMDAAFREKAAKSLAALRLADAGGVAVTAEKSSGPRERKPSSSLFGFLKSKKLLFLGVVFVALICPAAIAVYFLSRTHGQSPARAVVNSPETRSS